ncbi:MAG: YicC family protein [Candidatus Hydrogenedentota bacterium]
MIKSMTGFGRASGSFESDTITVEISTVNHRFLESTIKLPSTWYPLESSLREFLKDRIARGKVFCSVRRDRAEGARPAIRCDLRVAEEYVRASRHLVDLMNSTERLSLDTLVRLDGVFVQEESEQDLERIGEALLGVAAEAVNQLEKMRKNEGAALSEDLRARFAAIREAVAEVDRRAPELNAAYFERLRQRVTELNVDTKVSEDRIALEVAMLAEKTDVNEEIVRLHAHLDHAGKLLVSPEPVGRELNFLSQELQREINTLGSKLRDLDVTREVIRMKGELERVREQMNNVE